MKVNLIIFGPEPADLADDDGPYSHSVVLRDGNGARFSLTHYPDGRSDVVFFAENGSAAAFQNPTVATIINGLLVMAESKVMPIWGVQE